MSAPDVRSPSAAVAVDMPPRLAPRARRHRRPVALALAAVLAVAAGCRTTEPGPTGAPPAGSVQPGLNDRFLDPALDVGEFTRLFEGESREIAREREAIVDALAIAPGEELADVGAGTGLFLAPLAAAVGPTGRLYAVDLSPGFVEHLRDRVRRLGLDRVEVVQCTERSVTLPPASIDLAFVCDTYHHFEFPASSLASLREALRPGGRLVVVDFERIPGVSRDWVLDHVRAGKAQTIDEIEAAGFRFDGEVDVPGLEENYLVRFRRP